jgi:hypothetical protein
VGLRPLLIASAAGWALVGAGAHASDFAAVVVDYTPAPGQFVNSPDFNDPARALGAPIGGGLSAADNTKVVTLGGFGGSITLRFAGPVIDDPLNPWGVDVIVFGNAFYAGSNPNRRFAEGAIIEVSQDSNANGLADDAWLVIRGSSLPTPPNAARQLQAWDSNTGSSTPPSNPAWYPAAPWFPAWPIAYTTTTFRLPAAFEVSVLQNPNGLGASIEGYFGYADLSPTLRLGDTNADDVVDDSGADPGAFYSSPDNPFGVGVSPGSGGGDGIDLAWAVDPATGAPAGPERIDFIRISTGVNRVDPLFGEMSAEISGVADVRPRPAFYDFTGDGRADAEDVYGYHRLPRDLTGEGVIDAADRRAVVRAARSDERRDAGTR